VFWECLKITNFPAKNSHGGITNNSQSKVVLLKVSWHRHQDGGGHLNVTHISDITSNNSFSSVNKTETVTFDERRCVGKVDSSCLG
jgi:hypothetical protein